ncbi:GNAT family N-acetyltransferase [Spirosoma fluviale]|uniref:Ribosomal protein S18 acetylase RimI n=1 Tax=Spirosoma fluviale TaxID=1597977 RepID=A0A286G068_9BACT|nr:N-acetyltransferase [Spirosoma fluviale]SOD88905.1 Ribosomal protein S18 acetylase RimI [Spirosoma fluviale]
MTEIRRATADDQEAIWQIIRTVIATGDTYCFAPDSSREKMLEYWCHADKHTYVATVEGKVAGTFIIKDNQIDLGSHIANASYMVSAGYEGQGIGKLMGECSIEEARGLGYRAMQFNIVVKSNERAVRLWQKLGFTIIGEIPDAFNHMQNGYTNAYIMYRKL